MPQRTKLYNAWANMKKRCKHPRKNDGPNYANVKYLPEWENFISFKEWAVASGYVDGLSLDRVDTFGDYTPENCRWATMKVQANNKTNNKRITYAGRTQTLMQWSEELGFEYHTLKSRLLRGWDIERAFTEPLGIGRRAALELRRRDNYGRLL